MTVLPTFETEPPPDARSLPGVAGTVFLQHTDRAWSFWYQDGVGAEVAFPPATVRLSARVPGSVDLLMRIAGSLSAMLMDRCGFYPLHAAGLALDGGLVAIHGASGTGKSTLAGLLAEAGVPVAGDDLLALDGEGRAVPIPGALRMLPSDAPPDRVPMLMLPDGRGWYPLPALDGALPLRALVELTRGDRMQVEPVTGSERLSRMLGAGYLSHLDPDPSPEWHLRVLALAERTPVYRLTVPGSLSALRDGRDRLLELLQGVAAR